MFFYPDIFGDNKRVSAGYIVVCINNMTMIMQWSKLFINHGLVVRIFVKTFNSKTDQGNQFTVNSVKSTEICLALIYCILLVKTNDKHTQTDRSEDTKNNIFDLGVETKSTDNASRDIVGKHKINKPK